MLRERSEAAMLGSSRHEHRRGLTPEAVALVLAAVILIALAL